MPLDDEALQDIERQAVELAWGVGAILLQHFQGPLHVQYKGKSEGKDPVTEADHHAEAYLKEELARRFPDHAIVGEEGAGEGSEAASLTWAVDPLDGTTNFLNGLPLFASSFALLEEGTPIVAAVFVPWPSGRRGRVFHARMGGGAWEDGTPLRVSPGASPVRGRVAVAPNFRGGAFRARVSLRKNPGERRSVGSIAYELALAASGTYQYTFFGAPRVWDVAAGILLVQEAQGWVLTRLPRRRGWHTFISFKGGGDEGPPGQKALRDWSGFILAGNPEMVRYVGQRLRPHRPWVHLMVARLRRRLPRFRQGLQALLSPYSPLAWVERRRSRRG